MNVIADSLSRKSQILSTEWVLHRQVCADLWKRWGRPLVDLFATRLNYRIPTFCSPCPVSHGSGNGRVPPSMGRTSSLCLSPIPFDQEDTQQIEGVKEDGNDLNCPGLAPTGMVSGPPSADNGAPGPPSTQTRSSQTTTQRSALPRSPQASALRVETVQRLLKHKGFSSEVAKTVASSRRKSTNVNYQYNGTNIGSGAGPMVNLPPGPQFPRLLISCLSCGKRKSCLYPQLGVIDPCLVVS